ncbi:site-specific DNA-methyltransferase [Glutamicibacter sp. BW80]|uniref:site-specific DNA-methyltransferase n=1 Tax=unclassified Glutamicibacter TaxID=2627139 RepID=UPI000BB8B607|nr:site-specific DNA-methyltransferase [Glutamicibacter sp. BW80]PCC29967.1 site-specific DNA-methyltransferase [Glutamicibacter sp. BW80]
MEKRTLHSPDLTARNIERIAELFPNAVTEAQDADGNVVPSIDFDCLRQELSDHIVEGPQERYQLDWPGKHAAAFAANARIAKTLRPVREESVDFDTTKNLFIEGDNLDALKLLQESYLGKVKLIYIDPPYNTGNDFVYNDDFAETTAEYLARSVQVSESGERLVANPESNGRFHSDWLSMIYPRLKMARNLLHDDGLIFISIDSGESSSLKILCDEVFGQNNLVDVLVWQKKVSPSNDSQFFSNDYEHILVYAKFKRPGVIDRLERTGEHNKYYTNPDEDPRGPWNSVAATSNKSSSERPNLYYPIVNPNSGVEVWPVRKSSWKYSRETMQDLIKDGRLYWGASGHSEIPRVKKFLSDAGKVVPRNVLHYQQYGSTQSAKTEFRDLMGEIPFDYPKPTKLIEGLLSLLPDDDESPIVLDFFAGSGTTGQAVLQKNNQDGGNRLFILVQLPESLDVAARNLGFPTIADVARERIRRVGKALTEASESARKPSQDVGFRCVKVASTSKADLLRSAEATDQLDLVELEPSIKPGRTGEDLLFQVLLDWGLELTVPIVREEIDGREVFAVDDDALFACFAENVTPTVVRALAEREPLRVVFRDDAFESDAARINAEQIFKEISPTTEVRTI